MIEEFPLVRLALVIINLTILECKWRCNKSKKRMRNNNKSNHIGM